MNKILLYFLFFSIPLISLSQDTSKINNQHDWHIIPTKGTPLKREDCGFVEVNNRFYLVGGRNIKPVDVFDPKTNSWQRKGNGPVEMNHFQGVAYKNKIYVVGAAYGPYPHEKPLENIYIYNPETDEWQKGAAIPTARLRGSGGTVVYKDKIYFVCGIKDGHYDGTVSWLDEFDPATGNWRILPDAPRVRDNFQAVVIGHELYLAGGRRTSVKTQQGMQLTIPEIDVYDFNKQVWRTLPASQNLPTLRAGFTAVSYKGKLLVIGGESVAQKESHHEVEAFDTKTGTWAKWPELVTGRHDTGALTYKNKIYIAAGSANSGGGPDQDSIEMLQP